LIAFKPLNENRTTDEENGAVEGQQQLVQQRMSATLTTLFSARKQLCS